MWIAIAIVGAGFAVAVVAWLWARKPRPSVKAMKQFARRLAGDKSYGQGLSEYLRFQSEMLDEAEAAPPLTDDEIPRFVELLLHPEEIVQKVAVRRLEAVKSRAAVSLLAMLDDPRCTWVGEGSKISPAERVAWVLWNARCRSLGDRIGHLADDPDSSVYTHAIKAKAALGRANVVDFVITNFERGQLYRSSAEEGVDRAIEQGWAEPQFLDRLFEWARRSALDPSAPFSVWAIEFYVRRGGPEAVEAIRSPELLSMDNNRSIHVVIEQLHKAGVVMPPELMRRMIEKSLAGDAKWPWTCVFRYALPALAASEPNEARRIAERQIDGGDRDSRYTAIKFVRAADSLPEAWQTEPPLSMVVSAADQRVIEDFRTCLEAFGEIGNGGLSQYFFNSTGDRWPQVVEALRAIGFSEGADAMDAAARVLAREGASTDRDVRMKQYADLPEGQEKRLDALTSTFWRNDDRVMLRYMQRHANLFRRIKHARIKEGWDSEEK